MIVMVINIKLNIIPIIIDDLLTPSTENDVTDLGSGGHIPSIIERTGE